MIHRAAGRIDAGRIGFPTFLLVLMLALGCGARGSDSGVTVGQKAPSLELTLLDGARFPAAIQSENGDGPLLVNFWATWCGACKRALPELRRLDAEGLVEVLGVALDRDAETVRGFAARHELAYALALDDGRLFERFGGLAIPYSVLLAADGEVLAVYRGSLGPGAVDGALSRGDAAS